MTSPVVSTRIVGRRDQVTRLGEALAVALGGRATVALVRGEAGVGKSRLIDEFVAALPARGATVLTGGCLDLSAGDLPFVPLRAAFRHLIEERGVDVVAELLGPTVRDLKVLLPDVPIRLDSADSADSAGRGRHVFDAVSSVVASLARRSPLVLVIDDAQWADSSTLQMIRYLRQQHPTLRLLVVVAYRGEELPEDALWRKAFEELNRSATGLIDVTPLSPDEATAMVRSLREELDDAAVTRIVDHADGLPFLVEELVAAEADGLTQGAPSRFSEILRLRVGALSGRARRVVELVATFGRPAEYRLAASASGLSRRDFAAAVDEALRARVLVEDLDSRSYAFRHDIAREVVYRGLRTTTRSELHAKLAAALEKQLAPHPYPTRLGEVAHHWLQSDEHEEAALRAVLRAARASSEAYARPEAVRQYSHVLALWDRVDDPVGLCLVDSVAVLTEAAEASHWVGDAQAALNHARDALRGIGDDDPRADVLHERVRYYSWLAGGPAEVVDRELVLAASTRERMRAGDLMTSGCFFESIEVAREALRLAEVAQVSGDEIRAGIILGVGLAMSGQVDEGIATIRQRLADAVSHGSAEEVVAAHANLSFVLCADGQLEEAARVALEGLDEAEKRGAAAVDGALLAANAAGPYLRLGRLTEADRIVQQAMDRRPTGATSSMEGLEQILLLTRAEIDVVRGRLTEAETGLRAIVAGDVSDDYEFQGQLLAVEAELQLWTASRGPEIRLHDVRDASTGLGSDFARLDGDGDPVLMCRLLWLGTRADADASSIAAVTGSPERVQALLEDGVRLAARAHRLIDRAHGEGTRRQLEGTIALVEAELTRLAGEPSPTSWRTCSDTWKGEPYLRAYSLWRLGSALRTLRRRREAGDALREAYRISQEVGMGAVEQATVVAALSLGMRLDVKTRSEPSEPRRPFALTPREMEVMELLAGGASNRRIASALRMSEKTASVHVSHILTKLSASNRGEAIARAFELQIVTPRPS